MAPRRKRPAVRVPWRSVPGRARTWRPNIGELAVFTLFVVAAVLGLRAIGAQLERRMVSLRDATMSMLGERLDKRLSYGSISPSILRALVVHDLRIFSDAAPGDPLLDIHEIRIRYSLWRLALSRQPLAALREIEIAGSRFTVDLDRDRELVTFLQSLSVRQGPLGQLSFRGANLAVTAQFAGYRLEVDRLFFRADAGEELRLTARGDTRLWLAESAVRRLVSGAFAPSDATPIQLVAASSSQGASAELAPPRDADVVARVRLDGIAAGDLQWSDLTLRLANLRTAAFAVSRQSLRVIQRDQVVRVVKVQDRAPVDVAIDYDLATAQAELRFEVEGWRPADLFTLHGPLAPFDATLASTLTGTGRIAYQVGSDQFTYELALDGRVLGLRFPPAAEVAVRAAGDEQRIRFAPLRIDSAAGFLEFQGDVLASNLFPSGLLSVRGLQDITGEPLDARLRMARGDNALTIRGDRVVLGSTGLRDLNIHAQRRDANGATTFDYRVAASVAGTVPNSLEASGELVLAPEPRLTVASSITNVPSGRVYRMATVPSERQPWLQRLLDTMLVSGSFSGATDFHSLVVRAPEVRVRQSGRPANVLQLRLAATERRLLLERVAATWDGYGVRGESNIRFAAGGRLDMDADFSVDGQPYVVALDFDPRYGLQIDGSYDLAVLAWPLGHSGGMAFRASSKRLPVPLQHGAPPLLASLDLSGSFVDIDNWNLRSGGTRFESLPYVATSRAALTVGFEANQSSAQLHRLDYQDELSRVSGSGSVKYSPGLRQGSGWLSLDAADSTESYVASLEFGAGKLDGAATVRAAPSERLGEYPIVGDIDGEVLVSGLLDDLLWEASFALDNGRLNSDPIELSAGLEVFERIINVRDLRFDLLSHRIRNGRMVYALDSGALDLNADYESEFFGDEVQARFRLTSQDLVLPAGRNLNDTLRRGASGVLTAADLRVAGDVVSPWSVLLKAQADREPGSDTVLVRFSGGPDGAFTGSFTSGGAFAARATSPYPIRGTASGAIRGGRIEANATFDSVDLLLANATIRTSTFTALGGTGSGEVRITGPVNDPDFFGSIAMSQGRVASPFTPVEVGPFGFTLQFQEKLLSIVDFEAEPLPDGRLGSTPLALAGDVAIEHWVPTGYELQLQTRGSAGVPIAHRFGPVRFDGYATGTLSIAGAGDGVALSGEVAADFAEVAFAGSAGGGGDDDQLLVDLGITTGRRVEFTWPSAQFPIMRTLLAPDEQVHVTYDGASGEYDVQGEVAIRGGDVYYFDRNFILREGRMVFAEDETRFDPHLVVRAETRERTEQGEDIKIFLEADTALAAFSPQTVRFSSDPPQNELVIDALLGAPLARTLDAEEGSGFGVSAAALSGDLLAQVGLLRPLESAVRELLGLDLVSIRSPFVANLLVDRLFAPEGVQQTASNADLLDNTSLSLGKYVGSDLFLEMLLRLQTPELATANTPALESELELSLEWTTPFFLLEWSFLPQSPETLYLVDNSISLRWRWSY